MIEEPEANSKPDDSKPPEPKQFNYKVEFNPSTNKTDVTIYEVVCNVENPVHHEAISIESTNKDICDVIFGYFKSINKNPTNEEINNINAISSNSYLAVSKQIKDSKAKTNSNTLPKIQSKNFISIKSKQEWLDSRYKNFTPYFITNKDGEITNLCNFNITFLTSRTIGDKQFYGVRINYVNADGIGDYIEKDMDIITISSPQEFVKFFLPLSNVLSYERYGISSIISIINKELTSCNRYIDAVVKSDSMGWDEEGERYSTQTVDIYATPEDVNEEHEVHIVEGTTQFIDNDYAKIKDVKFTEISDEDFARTMVYLSNKWIKLNPVMPRLTGFVFISPFASFYAPYIRMVMYLSGRTGAGKTASAKALASFYGNIKDDKQLIAAKTSIPKISFYAHLYKDCIMVLDNMKEEFLSEKELTERGDFISKYADNQAREVMGKSRYGRGSLIVTGEETPQDASTLRKIDRIHFEVPIDPYADKIKPNVTELSAYTPFFSGVMIRYIKWMLIKYGTAEKIGMGIIKEATESPKLFNIGDRMLKLNYIGFSLFIEFMVENKYINFKDGETMLKDHLTSLIEADNFKLDMVSGKTSGHKYINAIKSLIKTNEVNIEGGVLSNKFKPTIGKGLKKDGNIVIYKEAYGLIRSRTRSFYGLPIDYESVEDQLKNMIEQGEIQGEISKPVKMPNGKTERTITFKPSVFGLEGNDSGSALSHTSIVKVFNQILINKGIHQMPSPEQFEELVHSMKFMFNNNAVEAEDWVSSALTLKGWVDSPSNPEELTLNVNKSSNDVLAS